MDAPAGPEGLDWAALADPVRAALCFGLMLVGVWLLDERLRAQDGWDEPGVLEEFARHRGLLQRYLLELAGEARALIDGLAA